MKFIVFLSFLFLSAHHGLLSSAHAEDSTVITYPVEKNRSNIDVVTTVKTIGEVAAIFSPLVVDQGTPFAWDFDWEKPWIGAGSKKYQGTFSIMLWGGFVRADLMTIKALQFTVCHEFGHFLGGAPFQLFDDPSQNWSSTEGQADWWAATVCLPALYRSQGQTEIEVRKSILQAGLEFAQFLQFHFHETTIPVSLEAKAQERPQKTLMLSYPSLQCRLDTIRIGGTCATLVQQNEEIESCERPRCWYVPTSAARIP